MRYFPYLCDKEIYHKPKFKIMLNLNNRLTSRLLVFLLVMCIPVIGFAQNAFTVEGLVKDANGEPIIGASIVENGTQNGTVSDIEGAFKLNVKNGNAVLRIS